MSYANEADTFKRTFPGIYFQACNDDDLDYSYFTDILERN